MKMKKIIYLTITALAVVACKEEPKDYVTFSGKITNQNSDSLVIGSNAEGDFERRITVTADGTFSDTLKVVTGGYYIFDGTESTPLYLKNGLDVHLTLDTKQFDETIVYTGSGAIAKNFRKGVNERQTNVQNLLGGPPAKEKAKATFYVLFVTRLRA